MTKEEQYRELLERVTSYIDGETCEMSVLANASALLHEAMAPRYFWTGFYVVDGEELVLGPFQGPAACYRIRLGRGVCGTAWKDKCTLVVPDVEEFPGHIACSSLSRSEIVVPLCDSQGTVKAVLDIDSRELAAFDETDAQWLEEIAAAIAKTIY
ncbi:MAG: GAF domain-containing protein [Muribaculaceae bacterium]|nr:GAF domain-containing protein [Muribaculaceae bacterium]